MSNTVPHTECSTPVDRLLTAFLEATDHYAQHGGYVGLVSIAEAEIQAMAKWLDEDVCSSTPRDFFKAVMAQVMP